MSAAKVSNKRTGSGSESLRSKKRIEIEDADFDQDLDLSRSDLVLLMLNFFLFCFFNYRVESLEDCDRNSFGVFFISVISKRFSRHCSRSERKPRRMGRRRMRRRLGGNNCCSEEIWGFSLYFNEILCYCQILFLKFRIYSLNVTWDLSAELAG